MYTTITMKNGWTTEVQTRYEKDYTRDIIFGWDEDGDDPQELWDEDGELILLLNPETIDGMCDQHHFYKELNKLIGSFAEVNACEGYHIIDKFSISRLVNPKGGISQGDWSDCTLDEAKNYVIKLLASAGITKMFSYW